MPAVQTKPLQLHRGQSSSMAVESSQLEHQIAQCHAKAKAAAEGGDISGAAKLILKALDCERKLAGRGPQVLQLIKPRG